MTYRDLLETRRSIKEAYIIVSKDKELGLKYLENTLISFDCRIKEIEKALLYNKHIVNCRAGKYKPIKVNLFKLIFKK